VSSSKNTKKDLSKKDNISKTESQKTLNKKIIKEKCDALIIEYCPKVFKSLRKLDDYFGEELYE